MQHAQALRELLIRIDGRGYKAFKDVEGAWSFEDFSMHVDHVQGDPFADPSRIRVILGTDAAGLPGESFATRPRTLGTACFLARTFAHRARSASRRVGTGRSGEIRMESPGQETLEQTAVQVRADGSVEARFTVGLPAQGRRVLGRAAAGLLTEDVPELIRGTLRAAALSRSDILLHAAVNEDAEHLREQLAELGLVAFVADGAILPRRSGVDDRPLAGPAVVPFRSPDTLRLEIGLPNAGRITGMGLSRGVTLLVGGGFHGKSTLLRALGSGVFNHCPGDGRERCVTLATAVKVRAEDGRPVTGVDISPFIDGLPQSQDTRSFTTENASGSTSQAAAIVESVEAGAEVLLIDEDTSATNFMIRDRRMQALVPMEAEPITPFVDRVRDLFDGLGVSTVLVLGGSGDYLDVADTVIALRDYELRDVTAQAHTIAERLPTGRVAEGGASMGPPAGRVVAASSVNPAKGRRPVHVKVPDIRTLLFGDETVDLIAVEQLVSRAQVRTVGMALAYARLHMMDERQGLAHLLDGVDAALADGGLDAFDERRPGTLAAFRRFELAAVLNRLRSLRLES